MSRIFGVATGNLYKWNKQDFAKGFVKFFEMVKPLDVACVEITFGYKEELYQFKLTKPQEKWLRSLEYVSLHAPFRLVRNADNEAEIKRQLDILQDLYTRSNAKNLVIHPLDIPENKILKEYDMHISTENLRKKRKVTIDKLSSLLRDYKKMDLCLDTSHAYTWSRDENKKLISAFKGKISQVHFSASYHLRDHKSLSVASKQFLKSLEPLKTLNVPILLEEGFSNVDQIRDELKRVKRFFEE